MQEVANGMFLVVNHLVSSPWSAQSTLCTVGYDFVRSTLHDSEHYLQPAHAHAQSVGPTAVMEGWCRRHLTYSQS